MKKFQIYRRMNERAVARAGDTYTERLLLISLVSMCLFIQQTDAGIAVVVGFGNGYYLVIFFSFAWHLNK